MRNIGFVLTIVTIGLFTILIYAAIPSKSARTKYIYKTTSASNSTSYSNVSLKGFTLGKKLPVVDRYNCDEDYYLDERVTTVAGVKGTVRAIYSLKGVGIKERAKMNDSRFDLGELLVNEYNAKWGVPIINEIIFKPADGRYLGVNRVISGVVYYADPYKDGFMKDVMDQYSVKLKEDDGDYFTGKKGNLLVKVNAYELRLIDIQLQNEIELKEAELKRNEAQRRAQDF